MQLFNVFHAFIVEESRCFHVSDAALLARLPWKAEATQFLNKTCIPARWETEYERLWARETAALMIQRSTSWKRAY